MRLIEIEMNNAIQNEIDWRKDNTKVINISGVSFVYLYDNLIAMIGDTWLQMFDGGYKTKTTKSRLNAILENHGNKGDRVYQKNHKWIVSTKQGTVDFIDGMEIR
jgi:hypothetical protein